MDEAHSHPPPLEVWLHGQPSFAERAEGQGEGVAADLRLKQGEIQGWAGGGRGEGCS